MESAAFFLNWCLHLWQRVGGLCRGVNLLTRNFFPPTSDDLKGEWPVRFSTWKPEILYLHFECLYSETSCIHLLIIWLFVKCNASLWSVIINVEIVNFSNVFHIYTNLYPWKFNKFAYKNKIYPLLDEAIL